MNREQEQYADELIERYASELKFYMKQNYHCLERIMMKSDKTQLLSDLSFFLEKVKSISLAFKTE